MQFGNINLFCGPIKQKNCDFFKSLKLKERYFLVILVTLIHTKYKIGTILTTEQTVITSLKKNFI